MKHRFRSIAFVVALTALLAAGCSGSSPATSAVDAANNEHTALVQRSVEEVRIKNESFETLFGLSQADWELDQDTGFVTFTSPTGTIATAPVQIVGTFNKTNGTWLWSWDNPSIEPNLAAHAQKTRDYGQGQKIADLTTANLTASDEQCWKLTALTCKLGGHQGAYRGDGEAMVLFLTFGEPTMQQAATK